MGAPMHNQSCIWLHKVKQSYPSIFQQVIHQHVEIFQALQRLPSIPCVNAVKYIFAASAFFSLGFLVLNLTATWQTQVKKLREKSYHHSSLYHLPSQFIHIIMNSRISNNIQNILHQIQSSLYINANFLYFQSTPFTAHQPTTTGYRGRLCTFIVAAGYVNAAAHIS